jgi:hypothetical protein
MAKPNITRFSSFKTWLANFNLLVDSVGDLSTLNTNAKTSVVSAVNEVASNRVASLVNVTSATYSVLTTDSYLTINYAGPVTLTLPSAATYPNRILNVRTITANAVNSANTNVVPITGGSPSTSILPATSGKWAQLISDGSAWQIVSQG